MNDWYRDITFSIGLSDLTAMDAAFKGYLAFLRGKVKPSRQRDTQIEVLQSLRERFKPVLAQRLEGTPLTLTVQEAQTIDAALIGFVWLVRGMVPASKERDEALAGFGSLRHMLARMLMNRPTANCRRDMAEK
jgi:hypothetical protein